MLMGWVLDFVVMSACLHTALNTVSVLPTWTGQSPEEPGMVIPCAVWESADYLALWLLLPRPGWIHSIPGQTPSH